jgi:predicted regulator of Ras-like GTPase activity (Roadblock/LC7/MglB family)
MSAPLVKKGLPSQGLTAESRIVGILEAFERQLVGVKGSAVADADGLPIANGFRESLDLLSVVSMSSLGLQSAKKVFETIGLKGPKIVILEGEDAKIVIHELGKGQASFIAVVRPETKLGFLRLEMEAAAKRLEEELGFTAPSDVRVEEVFLVTNGGLLITHASRTLIHPGDRDVLAAMMTVVQQFVRDAFQGKAGVMHEVEMANLRVRLVRGEMCTIAIVSTGPLREGYVTGSLGALHEFEEKNRAALSPWNGQTSSLNGTDNLVEELLHRRSN